MRLLPLIICLFAFTAFAQAQTTQQGFTFKYLGMDYTSPSTSDYTFDWNKVAPGIEMGYNRYLSPSFDLSVPFRFAILNSPNLTVSNGISGRNQSSFGLDVAAKYKLANGYIIKENAFFQPYLVAGLGLNYLPKYTTQGNFHIPVGVGANIKLLENLLLQGQAEYRLLGEQHLAYTGGLLILFGGEKTERKEKEVIKIEPSDKDGDGIVDSKDACPDVAGLAKFAGCPDTDGDGIMDSKDKCPDVAGLEQFNGCPDTDGDGIADNLDKCPKVVGLAELDGCPDGDDDNDGVPNMKDKCPTVAGSGGIDGCPDTDGDGVIDLDDKCPKTKGTKAMNGCPDTDGDGIADNLDKCPTVAGDKANNGCPILKKEEKERLDFAMRAIQFETGKSVIKTSSYTILDEVASILNKYPNYLVSVEGHTDNVGNDVSNMTLSEARAKACRDYLVKKGVAADSITSKGFGETQPVADNTTAEGREKNRRVEFKLTQK
jgi:outer membrane protein OmpA-like peptidoglycan-associated protein